MKFILVPAVCLLFLCGCQTAPGPAVSLVNVRFTQATALETTGVFTIRISNETPEPIQLDGGVHKIYINGLYVGKGLSGEAVDLPRLGTATQDVTVHLSNFAMVTRIKPIIESKAFDYRIKSILYGRSPSGRLHSENEGRLDLKDFTPTPQP